MFCRVLELHTHSYFTFSKQLSSDCESFGHFIVIIIVVDGTMLTIDGHQGSDLDVRGDRVLIELNSSVKLCLIMVRDETNTLLWRLFAVANMYEFDPSGGELLIQSNQKGGSPVAEGFRIVMRVKDG